MLFECPGFAQKGLDGPQHRARYDLRAFGGGMDTIVLEIAQIAGHDIGESETG